VGMADLLVLISFFSTHKQILVGFRVVPVPVPMPAGINLDLYRYPSGLISAGTRIFSTRCHL
jgi:hypothetical protein